MFEQPWPSFWFYRLLRNAARWQATHDADPTGDCAQFIEDGNRQMTDDLIALLTGVADQLAKRGIAPYPKVQP